MTSLFSEIASKLTESAEAVRQKADPEKIARALERNGYLQSIAGGDQMRVARAVAAARNVRPMRGVFLTGQCGCGKTKAALAIRRRFFIDMSNVKNAAWLDIESGQQKDFDDGNFIIDDLGAEPTVNAFGVKREYFAEYVSYFYSRTQRGFPWKVPPVITTNLTSDDITARYGDRVMSRLLETMCFVKMERKDRRREGIMSF